MFRIVAVVNGVQLHAVAKLRVRVLSYPRGTSRSIAGTCVRQVSPTGVLLCFFTLHGIPRCAQASTWRFVFDTDGSAEVGIMYFVKIARIQTKEIVAIGRYVFFFQNLGISKKCQKPTLWGFDFCASNPVKKHIAHLVCSHLMS